ncbi:MAG: helix-turn-helix domain-containing protein, partial [Myxococcales bacterium]|nr:helix-turn-helix domain-containing protein [Myxococcales bacterium]
SAATAPPAAVIVGGAERSGAPTGRREPTEAGSEAPPVAAAEPTVERPAPEVIPQRSEPAPGPSPSTPASSDAPRAGTSSEESQPRAGDGSESAIVPARSAPAREYRPEPRPRPYEVPAGVEINGDLLRQVRMARGLSLLQVSERTRIGTRHLENVEADRYEALPAPVYLRGILMSLARELGLDGLRVSRGYLAFVEARRTKG